MEQEEGYSSYRIPVPPVFAGIFSHAYVAGNRSDKEIRKTLLPSFQTILVFSFGTPVSLVTQEADEVSMDKCLVLGPVKRAFDYLLPPQSEMLVISFKDDAFFRFFGHAAITQDIAVHPDELLSGNCFTLLWSELAHIPGNSDRVQRLLDFCRPYLQARNAIARQIADFNKEGRSAVKTISEENNLSERAVQIHHKKYFGYSAKEVSRYQRFLQAIRELQALATGNGKVDWFELIDRCGYYDQSQLIHDFRHYLNLSPARYLKFQQGICSSVL